MLYGRDLRRSGGTGKAEAVKAAGRRNSPEAEAQENEWQKKADLPDSMGVGKRTRTTVSDSGNGSESIPDVIRVSRSSDDESLDSSLRKCLLLLSGPTRQCPVPLRMVAVPCAQRHEPNGAEFDVYCVFPLADLNKNATFRLTRT